MTAGLLPLENFDFLEGKFPTSHLRLITVKNVNRYEETDANQLVRPEDLAFIQELLVHHGMEAANPEVVLDIVAAAHAMDADAETI